MVVGLLVLLVVTVFTGICWCKLAVTVFLGGVRVVAMAAFGAS